MLRGEFGKRHAGAVRSAKVLAYYLDKTLGYPVCDLIDENGTTHTAVQVCAPSGGSSESWSQVPPPIWRSDQDHQEVGEVLMAVGGGTMGHGFILGCAYNPGLPSQVTTDTTDYGNAEDYSDKCHISDRVTKHAGVRVVFAQSGTWLVDLSATKKPARVQLSKDSFLRISQDGKAEEFVLLARATLDHLSAVHAKIDALVDQVSALADTQSSILLPAAATALAAEAVALGVAMDTVGAAQATLDAATAVAQAVTAGLVGTALKATHYPLGFDATSGTTTDTDSNALIAGCFRISDITIAEQE